VLLLALGTARIIDTGPGGDPAPWPTGIVGNPAGVAPVSPTEAGDSAYLSGSSVLQFGTGDLLYLPEGIPQPVRVPANDPGARREVLESREWLERGTVPGTTALERELAERALLDLRLLTRPNGASVAAPHPGWEYVWPRDASWAAVAFAETGHREEAYRVLRFLAGVQGEDGTWEARYYVSGDPVSDGREPQLDANGWFLWALWYYAATGGDRERVEKLWPAARRAAGAAAGSLDAGGLPPPGPDYRETPTREPNLGTAAPLRTGLRAAADLAARIGDHRSAGQYAAAAGELDAAIEREFAPRGYPRTPDPESGADSAVVWLGPPFAPENPEVRQAINTAVLQLVAPNGGLKPGESWEYAEAWTPQTAFFALSAAAAGDSGEAEHWLRWLARHRTAQGSLPEKVSASGEPVSVAPLGWTSAAVLLAAAEEPLPVPPEEPGGR
jgi:glucoamylase